MHVTPADFRSVRASGTTLRFAVLGDVAYVLAELPETGSAGTQLEEPCRRAHWAFVLEGDIELRLGSARETIPAGTAFHVPAGQTHQMFSRGAARLAGFEPIDPGRDTSDAALTAGGLEILSGESQTPLADLVPTAPAAPTAPPERGEVRVTAAIMGDLVFARAAFGSRAGYTTELCDVPHWGLVTRGSLAIESEVSIEVLTAGDVYACDLGPPGHRLQSAEPADLIDFTPLAALERASRVAAWRVESLARARRRAGGRAGFQWVALR